MIKLLIIGLDGATFNVIEPLCDRGKRRVKDRIKVLKRSSRF